MGDFQVPNGAVFLGDMNTFLKQLLLIDRKLSIFSNQVERHNLTLTFIDQALSAVPSGFLPSQGWHLRSECREEVFFWLVANLKSFPSLVWIDNPVY
jgi:hypothetical protein